MLWFQRTHHGHAVATQRLEFLQQVRRASVAVLSSLRDLQRVPALQLWLVRTEEQADTAPEAALLRLDDVTDDFVDAPLALSRTPSSGAGWETPQEVREGLARRLEDAGNLRRGHVACGTMRVTGFSMTRLTAAMH